MKTIWRIMLTLMIPIIWGFLLNIGLEGTQKANDITAWSGMFWIAACIGIAVLLITRFAKACIKDRFDVVIKRWFNI